MNKMNPFVNFIMEFVPLSDSNSDLLEKELTCKKFKTGDKILQEGSICKNILFIVSGKARSFFINHEGQDLTWKFHFNDTESKFENYFLFDYYSFLTQTPTSLSFQAIEDIEVVMLSYDSIQKLTSNSHILEKVASKMSENAYHNVHKRAFTLLTLNAKERYLQLLKEEPYLLNKFICYTNLFVRQGQRNKNTWIG